MRYFTVFLHGLFLENNAQIAQKYQSNAVRVPRICKQSQFFFLSLYKYVTTTPPRLLRIELFRRMATDPVLLKPTRLFHFDEYGVWVPPVTIIFLTYATSSIRTVWAAAAARQYFCLH